MHQVALEGRRVGNSYKLQFFDHFKPTVETGSIRNKSIHPEKIKQEKIKNAKLA